MLSGHFCGTRHYSLLSLHCPFLCRDTSGSNSPAKFHVSAGAQESSAVSLYLLLSKAACPYPRPAPQPTPPHQETLGPRHWQTMASVCSWSHTRFSDAAGLRASATGLYRQI